MFFNFSQKANFTKIFSLNRILEKHFSYSYIYYFFFPELTNDLELFMTKNNLVFAPILEHIFDINYPRLSDEGEGYGNVNIDEIINDHISGSIKKNTYLPWQFFLFKLEDHPESFLYKNQFYFIFFFSRAYQQTNNFFELEEGTEFDFGKWLYNFLIDRELLIDITITEKLDSNLRHHFSDPILLRNAWLQETFFAQQFTLFFDPIDRIFLYDTIQHHQQFLYFFFDTVFTNEIYFEFFKQQRSHLFESSSPFWSEFNYNQENFTGDKWLYYSMVDLEIFNNFCFPFDTLFFLEVDRIYFDFFLHFWFFNKNFLNFDNFFFRNFNNLKLFKLLTKIARRI